MLDVVVTPELEETLELSNVLSTVVLQRDAGQVPEDKELLAVL